MRPGLQFTTRYFILAYIPLCLFFKCLLFIFWGQIQAAAQQDGFEARGSLSFIPQWKPVLTNPALQLGQESMTGWKEVCTQASKSIINLLTNSDRQVTLATNCGLDVRHCSFWKSEVLELISPNRSRVLSGWQPILCVGQPIQVPNQ
jgi:hypothetical protein